MFCPLFHVWFLHNDVWNLSSTICLIYPTVLQFRETADIPIPSFVLHNKITTKNFIPYTSSKIQIHYQKIKFKKRHLKKIENWSTTAKRNRNSLTRGHKLNGSKYILHYSHHLWRWCKYWLQHHLPDFSL